MPSSSPSRLRSSRSEMNASPQKSPPRKSPSRSSRKSPSRTARKSPSKSTSRKSASRPRASRSRSRSRARSKSRGRSATRKQKRSPSPVQKRSSSPAVKKRSSSPSPSPAAVKRKSSSTRRVARSSPSTPTRKSARFASRESARGDSPKSSSRAPGQSSAVKDDEELPVRNEFGGPGGALLLMIGLPAIVILINLACGKECSIRHFPVIPCDLKAYFNRDAFLIYVSWLVFHLLLAKVPIGKVVTGQPVRGGKKLQYRCNGFFALIASLCGFWLVTYSGFPIADLYEIFLQLAVAAITTAFALSVFLYIKARNIPKSQRSESGNSGNVMYDFFMGRELNPRVFGIDLKFVCELRPGLIGWVMLNLIFVARACKVTNGNPNPALLMVTAFQAWYVVEALWFEDAILTTMDITHDGFGFMLAFGDLAWVPFLYTLQGKYLLEHPQQWSNFALAMFFALNLIGYIIFRGSNSQKNRFRRNPYDPSLAYLETLPTASGKRLLVSGWWGLCRHPNYLGDLIMALAWSLPCGCSHIMPYFYPIYFLVLLVNRAKRDDYQCRRKYGAAWDRYCQRVPYRIFPYVY